MEVGTPQGPAPVRPPRQAATAVAHPAGVDCRLRPWPVRRHRRVTGGHEQGVELGLLWPRLAPEITAHRSRGPAVGVTSQLNRLDRPWQYNEDPAYVRRSTGGICTVLDTYCRNIVGSTRLRGDVGF